MHQYKINAKAAFNGDVWQWHQDYGTWARDGLPIGLAHHCRLKRLVARGAILTWADVKIDVTQEAVRARREMEAQFAVVPANVAAG